MYKTLLNSLLCLLLPVTGLAQAAFNYVHYDTKDGLAGSTVYDIVQDGEGFIWFATENGLSRYDGTQFKNYTVKDGLPDNEVLKVFADSKGRVWVATFNKELCYYFDGKIYNSINDPMVKKIKLTNSIMTIEENAEGDIVLCDSKAIVEVKASNEVFVVSDMPFFREKQQAYLTVICNPKETGFYIVDSNRVFRYKDRRVSFYLEQRLLPKDISKFTIKQYKNGEYISLAPPPNYLSGHFVAGPDPETLSTVTYFNTTDGCWSVDTANNKLGEHYLPGFQITGMITDSEQNTWFSTFGNGAYKMPSKEIRTLLSGTKRNTLDTEIFCIRKKGDLLIAGSGLSKFLVVDKDGSFTAKDFSKERERTGNINVYNRLVAGETLSSGVSIYGFDMFLLKEDNNSFRLNRIHPVKSIFEINKDTIIVACSRFVVNMSVGDFRATDTIWHERGTKAIYYNNKYYIGTLNGLYEVNRDKSYTYLGTLNSALSRRITDIQAAPDGMLWIATGDEGVVGYKDGRVVAVLKDSNGLSSNICKTLFAGNQFLWVGTNKGINKINLTQPGYAVTKYSISDGLPSDAINALYVEDSIVWVGSPAGLTYFNEKRVSGSSLCRLKLLGVSISGQQQSFSTSYRIPYTNNNISFEYVAISQKSGGDMTYSYRLNGLSDEWKTTTQTNLTYQSLPPGDYRLELYAVNKFGVRSELITVHFSIVTPFWRAWWFYTAIFLSVLLLTVLLLNRRNKKLRKWLEEKNVMQKQFASLEQQALQSQMNPHFIFNCLNSIQQYILTNDKEKANKYLTGFASLMRQTLDNSGKKSITVADEVRYLKQYIEMERMRFGDSFTYNIAVEPDVRQDYIEIPAMLLQPYVENCLRHGIRYKTGGMGKIDIHFYIEHGHLCCSVKDNGAGREKTAALKSQQHIEYQSKGMSLTQKRIELLNRMTDDVITTTIIDCKDNEGNPTGTEVLVRIPL